MCVSGRRDAGLIAVGLVLLGSTAACSDQSQEKGTWPAVPSMVSATPAATAPNALAVTDRASVELGVAVARWMDVSWPYVVWCQGPNAGLSDELKLHDLRSGTTTTLATPTRPGGQIDWARVDAGTVVYSEQPKPPAESSTTSDWTLFAVDIVSGDRRELVRSQATAQRRFTPSPQVDEQWVAWAEATSATTSVVKTMKIGSESPRTLVEVPDGGDGLLVELTDDYVAYTVPGIPHRDVAVAAADGTAAPRLVSNSGEASRISAGAGTVAWEEPFERDPEQIMATSVARAAEPVRLVGASGGNAAIGDGFFIYWGSGSETHVRRLDGHAQATVQTADQAIPARLAADGAWVAWGSEVLDGDNRFHTTIHVGKVARGTR